MSQRCLMFCGVSCTLISIWGVIQLSIMGLLYKMESVTLYEDLLINVTGLHDMDGFYDRVVEAYASVSMNCFYAAFGYMATLLLSILCLAKAKSNAKKKLRRQMNDEEVCPEDPKTDKEEEEEAWKSIEETESKEETESTKGKKSTKKKKKKKNAKEKKSTKGKKSTKEKKKSTKDKEKKEHKPRKFQRHKMKRVVKH